MARRTTDTRRRRTTQRGSSYDEVPRLSSRQSTHIHFSERGPWLLAVGAGLFLAFILLRLVQLQIIDGPRLSEEAHIRGTQTEVINAKRGTIYDRNGNVLAMSIDCKTIYCNPEQLSDAPATAQALAQFLGGSGSEWLETITQQGTFVYVKRQVDTKIAEELEAYLSERELTGIDYLPDTRRIYPFGGVAGQILGFVGVDGHGLSGLELMYDNILSGTDGELAIERGARGSFVAGGLHEIVEPKPGSDIVISLDIDLQRTAEEAIVEGVETYEAESGSVLVYDPKTGEILAACSTPLLDLTDLDTLSDESMKLSLVSDSFEPGSTFKVLTFSIGIESGSITRYSEFTVPPKLEVGDDLVGDDDQRDYTMNMDVREILRRSSNTGTILVGRAIGADIFAEGVERFGIGELTGIDFPGEVEGLVTERESYETTTLQVMSFGQGVAIPTIQMARAVGAVANGGVPCTPHFLVSSDGVAQEWPQGERIISEETSQAVVDMMRTVVEEGTAQSARIEGYDIAGKTGTAEQALEGQAGYVENYNMSSLVGFANASDPSILVYVSLNGTPYKSAESSAYIFSTIMNEALVDMGVAPLS